MLRSLQYFDSGQTTRDCVPLPAFLWRSAAGACTRGMLQADACRKDPRECRGAQQSFGVSYGLSSRSAPLNGTGVRATEPQLGGRIREKEPVLPLLL